MVGFCDLQLIIKRIMMLWFEGCISVNTKADLRFDFMNATFIPDWIKEKILVEVGIITMEFDMDTRAGILVQGDIS